MRIIFAGTPQVAVPSLKLFLDSAEHDVVAVLTRPDAPAGRGRKLERSPVAQVADEYRIEVLTPTKVGSEDSRNRIRELAPDICVVVAYGALLPQSVLAIPAHGWINLHFSVLPAWRGAAPVNAAIRHGDQITGTTTFRIVRELDAGPIYGVTTETINDRDTAGDLLDRLSVSGARLLAATVNGIADGSLRAIDQPTEGISYAPKLTTDDSRITFTATATQVDRAIRAFTPEPGAWARFREQRLKLGPVLPVEHEPLLPGELKIERNRVLVGTATTPVQLGEVQAVGKRWMTAAEWARGSRITAGEKLT